MDDATPLDQSRCFHGSWIAMIDGTGSIRSRLMRDLSVDGIRGMLAYIGCINGVSIGGWKLLSSIQTI